MEYANQRLKLRRLDFKPVDHEGMRYLHLRDPLSLSGQDLFVPEPLIPVLPLLDGSRDLKTVQFSLILRHNLRISAERLEEMIAALDHAYLLENETYRQARRKALDDYHALPFRSSPMAGEGYPDTPDALTSYLNAFLKAGKHNLDGASRPAYRGLLSPHIDYPRGGPVYASVWSALAHSAREADLVIILGTDHFSEGCALSLTRTPYGTPYGVLPLPTQLLDRAARAIGEDAAFEGELHHRSEHSVDLAAVWLHFTRGGEPVQMLPVLVGDLDSLPVERLDRFVDLLRRECRKQRTLVVVAGDLAHVGPAFGGAAVYSADLQRLRADDEVVMATLEGKPAEALKIQLKAVEFNNVCGANPLYLASRLLAPLRVDRFGYAACPADEDNTSFVTIAGAGFI